MKSNNEKPEPKWLTKKEAMQYLKISQRTIENYFNQGVLVAYRLGGKIFLDKNQIDQTISMSKRD